MKLVEDKSVLNPNLIIITGEGRTELNVMRGLTEVYNGQDIVLLFPLSASYRRTGKKAIESIKIIPEMYKITSIIYIVDGDVFESSKLNEIKDYLNSIGVEVEKHILIQDAILFHCKYGNLRIKLYCIISGPNIFIEEEIAKFLNIKYGCDIDLSGTRDYEWKNEIKKRIKSTLREKKIRLENLLKHTGKKKLEIAFPNYCAVLKCIEENFKKK